MQRTGILLTLLASTTLVLVTACGARQETPAALPETVLQARPSQAAAPPAPPGQVVTRETVTTTVPSEPARGPVVPQPPPPRAETLPMPPSSADVWVPGYWTWNNGWQWMAGHWELPPQRTTTWVPGQWMAQGQNWVWLPGHWQ